MYGLKHLGTLLTKIRDKKCPYDFIEVMACPAGNLARFLVNVIQFYQFIHFNLVTKGCVNGGGQLRSTTKENPKAFLARVEAAYNEAHHTSPEQNEQVSYIISLSFYY